MLICLQIKYIHFDWYHDSSLSDSFVQLILKALTSKRVDGIEIICKKLSIEYLNSMFLNTMNQLKSMVDKLKFFLCFDEIDNNFFVILHRILLCTSKYSLKLKLIFLKMKTILVLSCIIKISVYTNLLIL